MTTYNRTPIYNVYNAGFYAGFQRTQTYKNSGPINLAATSGSHNIPGPAVGKIRIIFHAILTSLGSTPAITAELQPSGLFFGRALSPGGAASASALLFGTTQFWCLGFGETLNVTNTGSAACTLWYAYFDTPDTNRTLVRASFSDTPVDIIPAAPTGFYNKWLAAAVASGSNGVLVRGLSLGFNDDTVAAIVQDYIGGVLIGRQSSAAANNQVAAVVAGGVDLAITTQPYQLATQTAVTTRNVTFMGCYETFEGTP